MNKRGENVTHLHGWGFFYNWIKELISRHATADLTAVLNNSIATVTAGCVLLAVSEGNCTTDTDAPTRARVDQQLKPLWILLVGFFFLRGTSSG